jgi:hypothetical protein
MPLGRGARFEFAPFDDAGMPWPMNNSCQHSANPLIPKVQRLFSRDLALENDFLRQENKILRGKLGHQVPLEDGFADGQRKNNNHKQKQASDNTEYDFRC